MLFSNIIIVKYEEWNEANPYNYRFMSKYIFFGLNLCVAEQIKY